MAPVVVDPPPNPTLSPLPITRLADMLEHDFDQGRGFRPEVVWEVLRRAVDAEAEGAGVP